MKKILIILTLLLIVPIKVNATERETFGDELRYLEELKEQKRQKDEQKELTEAEYNRVANEIYSIRIDIDRLNQEIEDATKEIAKLEKEIEDKKEETDEILVFLQLSNGEKAYLEYIFESTSFTDFIHRVSVVEQLSKYNKEQINEMNELINKNNELKKKNAENIVTQTSKQQELEVKYRELGSRIDEFANDSISIEEEIEGQEEWIAQLREAGCSNDDDVILVCLGVPTSTGFVRPLPYGIVTSEFSWRTSPYGDGGVDDHSGIDLGGNPEWTPVYPVSPGVIQAKYTTNCGGNMLYVYHTVNGEKITSVYMHLIAFNNDYKVGDIVSVNSIIGYVGGSSTASYNGGYDNCTFGAHLHLTLAYGHTTNHRSTMFNPRLKIDFPWGDYWYSRTW